MEKNTGILKRTLSFFLAVLITLSSVPLPALATENVTIPTETVAETETVEVVTEPTEAPEEETTAPAEDTEEIEPSDEEEGAESPDEEEETETSDEEEVEESSEPSESEEEPEVVHEHDYEAVVTDPTCTEQGYTTFTCECGDSYVGDYVDTVGHTWGIWTELVAPTCATEGMDQRSCDDCGENQYRDTRMTGDPNRILVSNSLTKDYFAGKRVLLIGDSITAGVGTTKTYGEYLSESLGVTVTNKGSSGSGYCSGGAMATNKNLTEANVRNADIITIMLGVNDWDWAVKEGSWKGNPEYYDKSQTYYQLGDFNSTDTSTFYGALHAWCQKILTMKQIEGFEDKQFIVITPLITSWNVSVTGRKDWNQDKLNIHGHTFREYCTAIMEVCAYYDIPVFDANIFSGIYYKSAEDNNVTETGGDGVHVNAAGHALLAEALEEFLLEGYAYESRSVKNSTHTYVNGICTDCRLPYVCNHTYNAVVTAPTCTEQGYTTYTCECGDSYTSDVVAALGHDFSQRFVCSRCDHVAKVSVLGDSISTYAGFSAVKNAVYPNKTIQSVEDTWWKQVVDTMGTQLLVNNASGGSRVLSDEYFNGNGIREGNYAAYRDRCVNLHDRDEKPDVIFVFMGTNDFSYHVDSSCEKCQILLNCSECTAREDGNLNVCSKCRSMSGIYSSFCNLPLGIADSVNASAEVPTSVCEAYAIMLSKMKAAYPNAQIYCMGLLPRVNTYQNATYHDHGQPTAFNAELKKVAENAGARFISLEHSVDNSASTWNTYFGDAVHPTAIGMDKISAAVLTDVLGKEIYTVSSQIVSSAVTMTGESWAMDGAAYEASVITLNPVLQFDVRVIMNGVDVTENVFNAQTGRIYIVEVTGNILITVKTEGIFWSIGTINTINGADADDYKNRIRTDYISVNEGVTVRASNDAEINVVYFDANYKILSTNNNTGWIKEWTSVGAPTAAAYIRVVARATSGTNLTTEYSQNVTITCGHVHDYIPTVTAPTCTEQGYTTYTCACGDSYESDYVDALGHTYKNGICTGCGEEDTDGLDLNGLNVLCLGDSITAGQGLTTETRWTNVLASKYGWNLTNKSQGGISLSSYYYTANGTTDVSIAKKAEVLKTMTTKPDVIIVWGGHNDTSYRASPLGTWDDETTDSFKGALKYIAELADEYAPDATLFVLTPLWTTEAPSTLKVPENTTDNNWMFVDAIYEGAEKYGWIPINMDLCGITPFTKSDLLLDNIHPNEAGTEKIVEYLSTELASYGENSKKDTILFNKSDVSMKTGESTTLKAVLSPRSGTGTTEFTWTSSDSSVATVDGNGKITAVASGTAVVTANASNGTSADTTVSVACDHSYESAVTAPTCTEKGYTTYTCECGDSYVDDYVSAAGHTYANGICTACGAEHPNLTNYEGKVISILGDSISTFVGYIPTADGFNLEHYARYPQANLFTDVEHTWWMQVLTALDAKLGINESWRSTEVGNIYDVEVNSGYEGTKACMASTTRIQNLGSNGTPDVILFYGGTNDITQRRTVGTFNPVTAPTEVDLTSVKWDTVADAYVAAIMRMQHYYPNAEIIAMLPAFTSKNTDAVIEEYNSVFAAICEHYGVTYIDLRDCGITTANLPDGTHPDETGMDYITAAVLDILLTDCNVEAGEHIVHSVTHNLAGAESSLSYYKGISHGKSYVTEITGEDLTVTVTMDGVDITSNCYANGIVSITNVTGGVVITAAGREKTIYDDHLQQLPDNLCCGMNLWNMLTPENQYYTTSGWGNLSTGQAWSITIPVTAGDRIYANSFGKIGSNGNNYSSTSGIRVAYFDAKGVFKSLTPAAVYAEFAANGYLTIPEDVVAVCVPMWTNTDESAVYVLSADHTYKNGICTLCGAAAPSLGGKTISILGASISTFQGTSNGAAADTTNSTIRNNVKYYPNTTIPEVTLNDTWWMQVVNDLGLRLLVNNAWSGSAILLERSGTVGAYVNRCVQLHDDTGDNAGEEPDIICIQMGFNDFSYGKDTLGTAADIDYAALITADGYGTPATTMEATAIMLDKITKRYPNAEVYMFNHFKRIGQSAANTTLMEQLNASIETVCAQFGVEVVDLYTTLTNPAHIGDGRVHPNRLGMDTITEAVKKAITGNTGYQVSAHTVTFDLENVTADYGADRIVLDGDSFTVNLIASDALDVIVTMGGADITETAYADGTVTIDAVTADVTVTAKAVHTPRDYRWEFDGTDLACVSGDNALTKNAGTTTDGVFDKTRYTLERNVVLKHDQPWTVEWKCEGTFLTSGGSSGARIFTSDNVNANYNARYIFKSNTNGIIAMGEKTTTGSHNYGIALKDHGIDWTQLHTYRLENRIVSDGSNMVWLYVDGREIGPMNHYYVGTTDKGTTSDWLSGKDFVFPYMGTDTHGFSNCEIGYIAVFEGGAPEEPAELLSLRYDDHYDIANKTVEILDAGKPTSHQVGYGIAEGTRDTAVVTIEGNNLVATGIGTAKVRIDGTLYEITVTAAPISLILLIGQSNMRGSEGNANQSIVCPDGMVYSTYGDDRGESNTAMTVSNATHFAPSALTGAYSSINVAGTTDCLSGYPVNSLTETGAGKIGPDSGFAYEWVRQTGEKVWVVNAAHGGTSINVWQPGTTEYEQCQALFTACQETLRKEIAAGHFTLSHMAYFWCQGCSDRTQSAQWYVNKYLAMHNGLKTEMSFDHDSNADTVDKTFEFGGIIPVRVGSTAACYRDGVYESTNPYAYHESYVDLRFSGPKVAQYWMCNNPELEDIWMVCNIGEDWVWMPDGTNGVSEYFQSHYENGTVDYTTQVAQKASWYTPTTPVAVHDSVHYNQIGYNEIGRESVRNALIMLGELEAPETEATVEFISWDGYTPVESVTASTTGSSETLVVPMVYPVYKSKDVTYQLSDGLTWDYYDLLADSSDITGTLQVFEDSSNSVSVIQQPPGYLYADHLSQLPEEVCCGLNLWNQLEHDKYFFTNGTHWSIHSSGNVYSVTIPVEPGDRIFASAFGKAGENGSTSTSGIRVTFFSERGVVKTLDPAGTYAEFKANGGYLIVPEGTVVANIPMWSNSDSNELYILNRPHSNTDSICEICGKDSHIHNWSDWETVAIPTASAPGSEQRTCSGCEEVEVRDVEGSWQKYDLASHMAPMPEEICAGINLWAEMEHDKYYFANGTNWGIYSSGNVPSITVAVKEGDQIFASSFGKAGENGHSSSNGIRTTFFDAYGIAKTMTPAEVYAEFSKTGYLTAPEGSVAINIAMWSNADTWEVYVLNREHSYESTVTAPTCTEQGYTTYTCACGDSYVSDYVDATGVHNYTNGICTGCGKSELSEVTSPMDMFVFSGQSNMMGAAVLEPEVNTFTDQSWEYKYMPKLRGVETGSFVPAQNPAGEWHYNDLNVAYGDYLNDLSYKSALSNYSANTYFCPAMSNGTKEFAAQSEANMYPSASLPPYFATEYASYGHPSIYAHMAKGSAKIIHYFTADMVNAYNALISAYNAENNKSYKLLTAADLTGAGDAFDLKYAAMMEDYATCAPDGSINNKCFVWLQGESDGGSYIEYKLKMQVLWEHLQTLGFTHFFVLRVGYWGSTGILDIIKAQEDFCAENENCYIVTRAPSLIPHPSATTDNWWISEPDAEYDDCRDSYIVAGSSNHHFNEKAMQIFAERSAENIHRILYQGLDPILEEENIQGMLAEEDKPESEQPEDTSLYTSYVGTEVFYKGLSVSTSSGKWVEQSSSTAASTDLIPVASCDSVWIQYVFFLSEAHAVGGFYDKDGKLVAPLYYKDFGFSLGGGGGTAAFRTPETTNRVSIADIELATGKEISFVRFTAWQASAGGHANTEARVYHDYKAVATAPTCTERGYTTHTCACGDSYVDTYVEVTDHTYENGICTGCNRTEENLWNGRSAVFVGDSITAGTGTDRIYYQYLNETLGFDSVTAMGVAGSCISAASDYGQSNQPLINRYQNIPSADLIVVFMGTNDYGHETPLGAPTDAQDGTFYGALNTIVPALVEKHPSSKIVFVTPLHRYGFGTSKILGTQFTSDSIPNGVGATLGDYVEVLKTVCANNDVSVIDLYTECTLNPADSAIRSEYMPDGLHPNAAGHEVIAEIMESHIRRYIPVEKEPITETELVYGNKFASGFNQQNRASSRLNLYLKAGTVITLKDPDTFQWACVKTSNENSNDNLGYFPDSAWSDKETALVDADGWVGFVFKYRDETQSFDLTRPLSYYITIEESHTHSYESTVTAPTCTEQGYTTHTCTVCGDSYVDDYTDPRPLNILMIGNSFSWDAADFWYDMQMSMTYDAMKSMLAPPYDVHLAVMYKGSATLAYHATCAMKNTSAYTYTEIGPETNYQWMPSSGTNASNNILDQLEARDWDIIVIQSYQHEADGTEPRSTYTGGDARFTEPEDSVGYLLDYFAEHEPNADVYYYMPWATTKFYGNDTETGYHAMAKYTETTVPNLTGTNSGKSFAGIIPVGTGIQNARTTYFDALQFSSGTGSTALLKDPQNGLQYDSQHLSFGLGRYIAGIIVAETLIPQEMRKDSYVLPTVKDSPAVGELPQEYSVIGQLAAKYALQDPFNLTTLSNYDTELADRICEAIKTADYSADGIADEVDLKIYVESVVAEKLENMGAAEYSVTIHNFTLKNGQIADMEATVALRVGYTSRTVIITVTNGMAHSFSEWEVISVPSAAEPGLNRRACENCGFVEEVEVDGSWQKFALAEHLQKLPDDFCSETNLWDLLEPEKLMINHLGEWVSAGSKVYSVTIPVKPGEKIYANSFDQTDGRKGIQVSFIGDYGIVKTTFSSQTYNEFQANGGYLIAPEGAIAVNIPVWNVDADNNTIYFLDYDHTYIPIVTAPTCTEQGYTTHTCRCGDSYVDSYVDATGHSYGDWTVTTAPTCTEKGAERRDCDNCDHFETREVAVTGHTEAIDEAAEATCTETGLTEGEHCSVCETVLIAQEEISALGHAWNNGVVTKEPTEEAEGERTFTCERCGETRTERIPTLDHVHNYESVVTAPTCTEKGYTTHTCRCGDSYVDSYVDATGHRYGDWTVTTAPTCTEKGEERRDCGNCDHCETREVAATGHTEVTDAAVPATCTETGLTEGKHCSVCETVLIAQEEISALGHAWNNGVVTKEPTEETEGERTFTCERCGETRTEVIPTLDHVHNYESVVTEPNCTERGYTTHTCRCGDSFVDSYVDATGHSYGDWTVTTAPTCTEKGSERRDCGKCDHFETREVAATGHSYESVVTAPTCTERGYTTHTCHCGDSYVDSYVDATGHNYGDWTVTTAPTCTEKGAERRNCDNCNHFEIREVTATGHSYESDATAPTCTERGYTTHTCHCGDSYVDSYEEATGHSFGEWAETTAPTCTETGEERRDCCNCDHFETREVAATGHSYESVVTAPTCTERGYTTHTCHCGDSYVDSYVDATGHSYGDWTVTTAPTCIEKGEERRDCDNCDHFETCEVAETGHRYESAATAPTCTERGYTTHTCHCGDSYVDSYEEATGHSFGEWAETTAPTCTETGEERRDCGNCDHFETREVAATGHSYEAVATAPTCIERGYTTHSCHCGDVYVDSYTEMMGHSYGSWYVVKEATLEEEGQERRDCERCEEFQTRKIPTLEHQYVPVITAPTCTERGYTTHTCSVCGDSYQDTFLTALGHSFRTYVSNRDATCTEDGTKTASCERCDTTDTIRDAGSARGHSLGAWTVTKEPGCTEVGTERRACNNCDHFEIREVAATGHSYESVITAPDCTERGYTTHTCHCGDSYVDTFVAATGHNFGSWIETTAPTCTEIGEERRDCDNCDHFEIREVVATGHRYESAVTAPTCTERGYTTNTCHCGDSYVDSYVAATGHSFGEWAETTEPTCTETGEERRDCGNCDHFETREVTATGHSYEAALTEPTCTERGYTTYTCHCGDSYVDSYVAATGHSFGEWAETTAPTCTETGEERRDCGNCDHFETREVAEIGHAEAIDAFVAPTCTETGLTEGKHCSVCETVLVAQEEISALGHSFGEWEPVPDESGDQQRTCLNCGFVEIRKGETGKRLILEAAEVEGQTDAWIDGIEMPIRREGDVCYVNLPKGDVTNMITYSYYVGDETDVHTQYPVGMQVWMLEKTEDGTYTAIRTAELDNLLQYSGSSIRIVGNKGIRMITSVDQSTRNALTGPGLAGFKLLEYGTALCRASALEGGKPMTLGYDYVKSNYAYKKDVADPVFKYTADQIQYTNVLVGFTDEDCKEDIAMRPYIILEDADGETVTLYGGILYRSIGYIAYQNRNAFAVGSAAYDYVWGIIHYVYGDQYDADYKG